MSGVDVEGPPDAKRFRIDVNTQVSCDAPSVSTACSAATPLAGEAHQEGQSPAAPSSASYRSSNGSVVSNSDSPNKEEDILLNDESEGSSVGTGSTVSGLMGSLNTSTNSSAPCDLLDMLSKTMLSGVFGGGLVDDVVARPSNLLKSISSSPTPVGQGIPGALAVAQTPAAALFAEDDWSWHRNPAASIRSGGTNKQTPVWKYFVYNKSENLSRCIVGDCTYMLKGPHTSTLACHLKKHTVEYAEFQKLKNEYSRSKMEIQANQPKDSPHDSISPSGMDLSMPSTQQHQQSQQKPPKAPKKESLPSPPNHMNFLFRPQIPPSSNNSTNSNNPSHHPAPAQMLQNMMQLQQMMFISPSAAANSAAAAAAAVNSAALQQAGLQLAANGQIVQSKKWRGDDKKQREMQMRLAMALSTSHVGFEVLANPMWRDLMEIVQPKFNFQALTQTDLDHTINSISARLYQTIKNLLNNSKSINILVDVSPKTSQEISRITISAAIPTNNNYNETQVILLASRNLSQNSENPAEEISKTVEQVITSEFGVNFEMINRFVCSGLKNYVGEDCLNILDKQIEAFGSQLLNCFMNWLENSQFVDSIRKSMFTMIFSVIANQTALQMATKLNCGKFDIPITEPFPILIETICTMRECFKLHQIDGFVGMSDSQWTKLAALNQFCNLFKSYITYSNCNSEIHTIDTVVPFLQQVKNALEKDIYNLGNEMASELKELINEKMAFILDKECEEYDSTYIQATALNPQLAVILNNEQIEMAKELIEQEVAKKKRKGKNKKITLGVDSILANVIKSEGMSNIYSELFQNMAANQRENEKNEEELKENIVGQYFDEISSSTPVESIFNPLLNRSFGNPMQTPMLYWKSCSSKCPELAEYAQELLSIPIYTLTSEKCHQFHPNPSPYHQLNLNILEQQQCSDQFEKQTLLRLNRQIVAKLL